MEIVLSWKIVNFDLLNDLMFVSKLGATVLLLDEDVNG